MRNKNTNDGPRIWLPAANAAPHAAEPEREPEHEAIPPPESRPRIELKTDPLGFLVKAGGRGYWLALDPIAAQSLAYALLMQPGVGFKPKEEFERAVQEEAAEFERKDSAFLHDLGVTRE